MGGDEEAAQGAGLKYGLQSRQTSGKKEAWRWRNEAVAGRQLRGGHIDKSAAAVLRSRLGSVGTRSRLLQGLCSSPESHRSDLPAASAEGDEEDGSSSGRESAEAGA